MTRADIEEMLRNLAETTRTLRKAIDHVVAMGGHLAEVADHLQEIAVRTDVAITNALIDLGDEEENKS
ncbi:MAG TPA: hypothetical protein VFD81_10430 [Methylomirabilota bacterium]|nr:hypothetical protein [Methylomirabilota bacterium]